MEGLETNAGMTKRRARTFEEVVAAEDAAPRNYGASAGLDCTPSVRLANLSGTRQQPAPCSSHQTCQTSSNNGTAIAVKPRSLTHSSESAGLPSGSLEYGFQLGPSE